MERVCTSVLMTWRVLTKMPNKNTHWTLHPLTILGIITLLLGVFIKSLPSYIINVGVVLLVVGLLLGMFNIVLNRDAKI